MKFDLSDAVLVRAYNNYAPVDRNLRCANGGFYLRYLDTSDYRSIITKIFLKNYKEKYGKELSFYNEEEAKIIKDNVEKLLPLTGVYNSTLSFSINGLVHDDVNNYFSNYNVCVIDPLSEHLDNNYILFNVNDTTIKGNVYLSDKAIMVINEDFYNSLSENDRGSIQNNYHVELIRENLKDGVKHALEKYGYPALELVNNVSRGYVEDSEVKDAALGFIENFADEKNISNTRLFYIYTSPRLTGRDKDAQDRLLYNTLEEAKAAEAFYKEHGYYQSSPPEIDNMAYITKYYRDDFYEYLVELAQINGIEIDELSSYYLTSECSNSEEVLEEIVTSLLKIYSLEDFAKIIYQYNQRLIANYRTPNEIIEERDRENKKSM